MSVNLQSGISGNRATSQARPTPVKSDTLKFGNWGFGPQRLVRGVDGRMYTEAEVRDYYARRGGGGGPDDDDNDPISRLVKKAKELGQRALELIGLDGKR